MLQACQEFVDLAHAAAAACVGVVFSDPGVVELISRVACTEQWERGVAASSIVATLDDFMQVGCVWGGGGQGRLHAWAPPLFP